jgi:hypothetical protein
LPLARRPGGGSSIMRSMGSESAVTSSLASFKTALPGASAREPAANADVARAPCLSRPCIHTLPQSCAACRHLWWGEAKSVFRRDMQNSTWARKTSSLSLRLASSAGNPLANTVSESEPNDQNDCDLRRWGAPERDRPAIDAGYSSFGSELKTQWPFGGLHLSRTVLHRTRASHYHRR